jgi:DNA topoisomerase-3
MTAFNSKEGGFYLTTVGRVQTPTLSIVVEREEKIKNSSARLLGSARRVRLRRRRVRRPLAGHQVQERRERSREARRAPVEQGCGRLHRAGRARKQGSVTEEAKPTTSMSPGLFDLTSLQREANSRFGFSAKNTLGLAQALYEKHKVLTYPRTDSRHLPEDYLATVKQTLEVVKENNNYHQFAKQILDKAGSSRTSASSTTPRSDHFAIIPTTIAPKNLSEPEQKLYDLVTRRFLAVFFPAAEFQVTTRFTEVSGHTFKTEGKVMTNPGWLAIYGKEADGDDKEKEGNNRAWCRSPRARRSDRWVDANGLVTKPPARYTEATLLSAMEGAGKLVEDDELRDAMAGKGLGTPATRRHIEGLMTEKYAARRPRADADRQSIPADDPAARPGRERTDRTRADRRVGIQAVADGEGQNLA